MCGTSSVHGVCVYLLFIHLAPGVSKLSFFALKAWTQMLITESDWSMNVCSALKQDKATCGPLAAVQLFIVEEVKKSTRNRNVISFCLLLTSLGKFNKVNCPSFTRKTNSIGAISNKLTVIPEAESRVQWCLSRMGRGQAQHCVHELACPYKEVHHALTSL